MKFGSLVPMVEASLHPVSESEGAGELPAKFAHCDLSVKRIKSLIQFVENRADVRGGLG